MDKKLDPLPDSAFDGVRISKEVKFISCEHKFKKIDGTNIFCGKCGVGYSGPNIDKLLKKLNST